MFDYNLKRKIIIQCAPLIAPVTATELERMNLPVKKTDKLHVESEGDFYDAVRLNLRLRTANRVLLHLFDCKADHPDQLYAEARKYPWEEVIKLKGYFNVQSKVNHPTIKDHRFASLRFKDAIADRFTSRFQKRPNSGPDRLKSVIFFYWQNELCQVYLDTSGETIARHNYRQHSVKAPMMETLAAAVILTSQWKPEQPFINPMCGSGTLAIEAALMSLGINPGTLRKNFSFMHLPSFSRYKYQDLLAESAPPQVVKAAPIVATDQDAKAIDSAKKNADLAGVRDYIKFQVSDFRKTKILPPPGVVMLNPEYGARLGDEEQLETTYTAIGDFFKQKCEGHTGYVFTGNLNLAKKIGLKTSRKIPFLNGKIDSRLLEFPVF